MFGWACHYIDSSYCVKGDQWFGASFGGPADGPGGLAPCAGPYCANTQTDWAGALPDCNVNPTPCFSGGGVYSYLAKNFGEGNGTPASQTHLAYRLGGVSPVQNRTVFVDVPATAFLGGSRVRLKITRPSGVTTTTICSASPCAAAVDARQGDHLMQILHLSPTNGVLATGNPGILKVQ